MADIVDRLREAAADENYPDDAALMIEAADEIERLAARIVGLEAELAVTLGTLTAAERAALGPQFSIDYVSGTGGPDVAHDPKPRR
jgi:hypothetical protein